MSKIFDPASFTAPKKRSVLETLNSGIHWKDAMNAKKILFHEEQEVSVIVNTYGDIIIVKFTSDKEDEIVIDYVKKGISTKEVKKLLDDGVDTSKFCTLGNAMFVKDDNGIGDERVRQIMSYVKQDRLDIYV